MARVLVATDGSELAEHAARRAREVLGPDHQATLLTVVALPVATALAGGSGLALPADVVAVPLDERDREPVAEQAHEHLDRLAAALDWTCTTQVAWGDAGTEVCAAAKEGGYDVVVVGSHGSGALKRALLGSVSHYVLHHATCPVLVVRSEC